MEASFPAVSGVANATVSLVLVSILTPRSPVSDAP